ncbi:hypothetical protein [Methylotenera sp.]|uniref:hypothetical protein n=1 Tax=Methylotenera sp. TaxID=2051956 RepID=UPI0027334CDD|nr:hypothetical protein [Methylotenera sp.]MDP3777638.1 hypothetical protein [Methylotenera sp.]
MTNSNTQLSEIEKEKELSEVKDDLFRKVGRNLINYQIIEQLLKQLILSSRISGPMSQLEEAQKQKSEEVKVQTMGVLAGQFIENTYQKPKKSFNENVGIKETHFSSSIYFDVSDDTLESRKADLKRLTEERNNLAHHLLPRLDLNSIESCLAMSRELDEQREVQVKEFENLTFLTNQIGNTLKEYADFMNSEDGLKLLELRRLQQSSVIGMLLDLSETQSRPDGWTVLDNSTRYIKNNLADDLVKIKQYEGCKTMKSLVITSELFDILEESTKKGGTRVLYRAKPDLSHIYH